MVNDRREVGAGARWHELGGLNESGGKFHCGELRNMFTILCQGFYEGHLWVGGKILALAVLELDLAAGSLYHVMYHRACWYWMTSGTD